MSAPQYTADDYLAALQALLPRGAAWPREPGAVLTNTLRGFAPSFVRSNAAAAELLVDAFPATADALLPDWESSLGLPDPFAAPTPTGAARRAAVVSALTSIGDMSIPTFIALAAALGKTIAIDTFLPFTVATAVSLPIYGQEWAHAWRVRVLAGASLTTSPVEVDVVREAPASGDLLLEAMLAAYKPANTICIVRY